MKTTWIKLSKAAEMIGHPARTSACKAHNIPKFWDKRGIKLKKILGFWHASEADIKRYLANKEPKVTQEQQLLIEMRKRAKLKDDARYISYRELECPPFHFNSPASIMNRLSKKHTIKDGNRIGSRGATYKVYRIEE